MSITYLDAIREAQARALADDPRVFIYGQDVGAFGGAFKATKNLAQQFPGRVIDSPISEDAMIGMAVGAATMGMRPIIEIQFADFSTVAFNQIVNQAATLHWRTRVPCPITVRLPGGGTSGSGPFHSQSLEGIYAHYPGLVVMTPATVEDAYSLLLEAVAALGAAALPCMADDPGATPVGRTAVARPAAEWDKDGKPVKLEFDFGDFKAWARRDGSWGADGTVQHRGLWCGTYTLSLRLCHGNPGCVDVQWFREPGAVATVKLCNDAVGPLSGGNNEFRDVARFDEITCAERVISCTGNCK